MFKDVIISSISLKLKVKKGFIMLLSFLIHSTIIFAVLIGPLVETDTLFSELKVVDVFLVKAPPQAPKAIRGGGPEKPIPTTTPIENKNPVKKPTPPQIEKLIVPDIIPDIVVDDDEPWKNEDPEIDLEPGIEGLDTEGLDTEYTIPWDPPVMNPGTARINIKQAKRIHYVKPIYSKIAKDARVFGMVKIEAKTDIFGNVVSWKVISGHPLLNGSAINAIKKWKYAPYLVGAVPKPVSFTVTMNFTLAN